MLRKIAKVLGFLWAIPNTIVGLVAALACRSYPMCWSAKDMAWHCVASKWPSRRFCAITLGCVIVYRDVYILADGTIVKHELEHVRQGMILGPLHFPIYGLLSLLALVLYCDIYHANLLEIGARNEAGEQAGW